MSRATTLPLLLAGLAIGLIAVLVLSQGTEAVEYRSDVELTGILSNQRIDAWANITVPENGTLDLRNVTVVFHGNAVHPIGLRALRGSTVTLSDGDGNPLTAGDWTRMTGQNGSWFLVMAQGKMFATSGANISNAGRNYTDPEIGDVMGTSIKANNIRLEYLAFLDPAEDVSIQSSGMVSILRSNLAMGSRSLRINPLQLIVTGCEFGFLYMFVGSLTTSACREIELVDSTLHGTRLDLTLDESLFVRECLMEVFMTTVYPTYLTTDYVARVEDTTFNGSAVGSFSLEGGYRYVPEVTVDRSTFTNMGIGIYGHVINLTLTDCRFLDNNMSVHMRGGNLMASDVLMESFGTGIFMEPRSIAASFVETLTVMSSSFSNGTTAVSTKDLLDAITVRGITFTDLTTAIMAERAKVLHVELCAFSNITYGIVMTPADRYPDLLVNGNTMEEFTHGIWCSVSNGVISGNTLLGWSYKGGSITGIYVGRPTGSGTHDYAPDLYLQDNLVRNCSVGVHYSSVFGTNIRPTLSVRDLLVEDCETGLAVWNTSGATVDEIIVKDCQQAIGINGVGTAVITNVTLEGVGNGVLCRSVSKVQVVDLVASYVTGWAIRETATSDGSWKVNEDVEFVDCLFQLVGDVEVHGTLHLQGVFLNLSKGNEVAGNIDVLPGGNLDLEESTVTGSIGSPFHMRVQRGGGLSVVDSTIAWCGNGNWPLEGSGPYINGSVVRLNGLTTENCYRGLVLRNASAILRECTIAGMDSGLHAIGSNVSIRHCDVSANWSAVFLDGSFLEMDQSSISGNVRGLYAKGCTLDVNGSGISANYLAADITSVYGDMNSSSMYSRTTIFIARDSNLTFRNSFLEEGADPGSLHDGTHFTMYDTRSPDNWTVSDNEGRVEIWWSHYIAAVYNWSGEFASGETVTVTRRSGVEHVTSWVLGENATHEMVWLRCKIVYSYWSKAFGPFEFSISREGISGRMEASGEDRFAGTIVVHDTVAPTVDILDPEDGTFYAKRSIKFSGRADDVGSGVASVSFSLDGGVWEDISVTARGWTLYLQLVDDEHHIAVRVADLDGHEASAEVTFHVDTLPPLAAFSSPANGTVVANTTVLLRGFTITDAGAPISEVHIAGVLVYAGKGDLDFNLTVTLPADGPNTFSITITDLVNNTGVGYITVIRDLTLPQLRVDPLPRLTNQREIPVSGTCSDVHITTVSLDGYHLATLVNGTFEGTLALEEGMNEFLLTAEDVVGNLRTVKLTVELDTQLRAEVVEPSNLSKPLDPRVRLVLETDTDAFARVRDITPWTNASGEGRVELIVNLEPGREHLLYIDFIDRANNTATVTLSVRIRAEDTTTEEDWPWYELGGALAVAVICLAVAYIALGRRTGPGDGDGD